MRECHRTGQGGLRVKRTRLVRDAIAQKRQEARCKGVQSREECSAECVRARWGSGMISGCRVGGKGRQKWSFIESREQKEGLARKEVYFEVW